MKTLSILISLFIFVSCDEKTKEEIINEVNNNPSSSIIIGTKVAEKDIEYIDGTYKSECIIESDKQYYYLVYINNYEVTISKFVAERLNGMCDSAKEQITTEYNVNGTSLDYVKTDHVYFNNFGLNGTPICGVTGTKSGTYYNIDNINCNESLENVVNVLSVDENDNYTLNGHVFSKS